MYQEGDIVEIPLPDGHIAIGWILHVSKYFKDAVGFVVFGIKGRIREDVFFDGNTNIPSSMPVLGPLYTHINALEHYVWTVIAHQPVSESKRQLTRRQIGGGVYVGDEFLGSTEELGELDLKPMLAMGMPVIYAQIENAFGENT